MKGKLLPLIPFFNVANFRTTKGSSKNWGEMFEQPIRKKKAVREYFTEQLFWKISKNSLKSSLQNTHTRIHFY